MMFKTPREAILEAENERLKAENAYLRRAVDGPGIEITPIGVVEEMQMHRSMPDELRLPKVASVRGRLSDHGNYHVVAQLRFAAPEDLEIRYHAEAATIKMNADYAVNELLPMLHERFVRALAGALAR